MKPCFSSTTLCTLYPAWLPCRPFTFTHSGSVLLIDLCPLSRSSFRMFSTLHFSFCLSWSSSFMDTKDSCPCSFRSAFSHSERITSIRLSTSFSTFSHLSSVQLFFMPALARNLLPSKNNVLPSIRSSFIHRRAHSLRTWLIPFLFFLRNSAMVLWSGFNPPTNQINDRL